MDVLTNNPMNMAPAKQVEEDGNKAEIRVRLKPGREKPVLRGTAWIFSGAIEEVEGAGPAGTPADLFDFEGEWLGRGLWHPEADMTVRMFTRNPKEILDEAFFRGRIRRAVDLRHRLFGKATDWAGTTAYRMVFSEADGLSGLVADQYADVLVLQVGGKVWEPWLPVVTDELKAATGASGVAVRADADAVKREGLSEDLGGETAPDVVTIRENGHVFEAGLAGGQKTGFYLDQRDNRARVARYCERATVLNAFSFTGAFAAHALAAGAAHVTNLDSSAEALQLAETALAANGFAGRSTQVQADAFEQLRAWRTAGQRFDVVILDPPKFAHNTGQIDRAARAYKDLNRIGLALVKPGGVLVAFSCSGVIDAGLFQKILFSASLEAGREAQVVERLTQASDHPVLLTFPESEYLKGLICRVA